LGRLCVYFFGTLRTGNAILKIQLINFYTGVTLTMRMRNLTLPSLSMLALALAGCGSVGGDHLASNKFTLAVIGDMPYGAKPNDTAEFDANPAFIAAINKDKDVSMVLHAGDIHSGSQYCTLDYNAAIYNQWTAYKVPLVYTPGDNEWADCHKKKEGGGTYDKSTGTIHHILDANGRVINYAGGDPLANLDLVRSIFFSPAGKTLGGAMTVHTQAQEFDAAHPADNAFVENVWFEKAGVLFVTLNIPGGSNNGTDPWFGAPAMSPVQQKLVTDFTGAAMRWLDTAFAKAKANGDTAVVIMEQADMWDLDGDKMADQHLTAYKQYIDKIATLTTAYAKPVLLINGDSHIYRSDNPLIKGAACKVEIPSTTGSKKAVTTTCADSVANGALKGLTDTDPFSIVQVKGNPGFAPSYNVANFHRLVVHGNAMASKTDQEYVKLTIDPSANAVASENAFGPFTWTRVQP
jgi:hypothetical protein